MNKEILRNAPEELKDHFELWQPANDALTRLRSAKIPLECNEYLGQTEEVLAQIADEKFKEAAANFSGQEYLEKLYAAGRALKETGLNHDIQLIDKNIESMLRRRGFKIDDPFDFDS